MIVKKTIIVSNTYNNVLSIFISLFFAYILEKLYTIHQNIITLNYYIGKSYLESTDMLVDLLEKNTILSTYTIFSLLLMLISFLILLYLIECGKVYMDDLEKQYLNIKNSYNIMLFFCIFIWIYFTFLSFIGSIKNFNILIYPQQILSAEIEKDVSTIILTMVHNIIFLKANILHIIYVVFSTVIISLFYSIKLSNNQNKPFFNGLLIILIICTIVLGVIYYYSPELTLIGEYVVMPAGPNAYLGPLFNNNLISINNLILGLYISLGFITILRKN
ncbi:MAG: hypothetical protein ABIJ47_03685 [Candidatus Bathyarchaeota archaeon]